MATQPQRYVSTEALHPKVGCARRVRSLNVRRPLRQEELRELFAPFGTITDITILRHKVRAGREDRAGRTGTEASEADLKPLVPVRRGVVPCGSCAWCVVWFVAWRDVVRSAWWRHGAGQRGRRGAALRGMHSGASAPTHLTLALTLTLALGLNSRPGIRRAVALSGIRMRNPHRQRLTR